MHKKPAEGDRYHWRQQVTNVPVCLIAEGPRWEFKVLNESGSHVYLSSVSGQSLTHGMALIATWYNPLTDQHSRSAWWAQTGAGETGTVSCYVVR